MYRQKAAKWYKSKRWQKMREKQLKKHPYCQCPHHEGKLEPANTADHIKPHRGDRRLFWDKNNLQSMTASCHNSMKQSLEKNGHGFDVGCGVTGEPLNRDSIWYDKQNMLN